MRFVVRGKLTKEQAEKDIKGIEQWFKGNPRRRVCRTDYYINVRRNHIREDILKITER